jgi:hypothetical protein
MDRVVPEGKDFTRLSVGELDTASRQLGENVIQVVADPNHVRSNMGFAMLAHMWAKRQDPKAELETFTAMETEELFEVLGLMDEDDEEPETPTTPAPA